MAKEKYDTLMKSCPNNRRGNNDENASRADVPFTPSDEGQALQEPTMPDFSDMIQYALPRKMQNKAKGLMHYLNQYGGDTIKFDRRGQLIVNGNIIGGSHLIDLLRDAVFIRKR